MEILVKKINSWMDEPEYFDDVGQLLLESEDFVDKYKAREAQGDIIEVREDGYFLTPGNSTGKGWNKKAFYLIIAEGVDDVPVSSGPVMEYGIDKPKVLRAREQGINLGLVTFTDGIAELNKGQLIACLVSNGVRP